MLKVKLCSTLVCNLALCQRVWVGYSLCRNMSPRPMMDRLGKSKPTLKLLLGLYVKWPQNCFLLTGFFWWSQESHPLCTQKCFRWLAARTWVITYKLCILNLRSWTRLHQHSSNVQTIYHHILLGVMFQAEILIGDVPNRYCRWWKCDYDFPKHPNHQWMEAIYELVHSKTADLHGNTSLIPTETKSQFWLSLEKFDYSPNAKNGCPGLKTMFDVYILYVYQMFEVPTVWFRLKSQQLFIISPKACQHVVL